MTDRSDIEIVPNCDHGLTTSAYIERCLECGEEVAHRPPDEAMLRARLAKAEQERDEAVSLLLLGRAGGAVGIIRRLAEPDPAKRYSREGLEAEARNYLRWNAAALTTPPQEGT